MHSGEITDEGDEFAAAPRPSRIEIVDVAKALNLPRGSALQCVGVSRGELVAQGDVLATRPMLGPVWQRTCVSPVGGRVADLTDGLIFIRVRDQLTEEEPVDSSPGNGAESGSDDAVEEPAAVVRAVWGTRPSAAGPLQVLVSVPAERLNPQGVGLDCRGGIIVVGALLDRSILLRSTHLQVQGIIAGGVDPRLMREAQDSRLALMVTEGAGALPINETIFELLAEHEGTEVQIRGGHSSEWGGRGPELVIPLTAADDQGVTVLPGRRPLKAGDSVRLTRAPYRGHAGRVIGPEQKLTMYRSGIKCPAVRVQLSDGRRVYVPYTNLELMSA